jgi:hypothetical protein
MYVEQLKENLTKLYFSKNKEYITVTRKLKNKQKSTTTSSLNGSKHEIRKQLKNTPVQGSITHPSPENHTSQKTPTTNPKLNTMFDLL